MAIKIKTIHKLPYLFLEKEEEMYVWFNNLLSRGEGGTKRAT